MKTNDNATASTTPTLDALAQSLGAFLPAELRWQLAGWASHLREMRHANHAANSWAKHAREFGRIEREAHALTVAVCFDFGLGFDGAVVLIRERVEARAEKAAA
jgi:hypothetical protein